jgi:hypothetical protein
MEQSNKTLRKLPKMWTTDVQNGSINNSAVNIAKYASRLIESVNWIASNSEEIKKFNAISSTPIQDYRVVLNNYFWQYLNLIFDPDLYNKLRSTYKPNWTSVFMRCALDLNRTAFIFDDCNKAIGLSDNFYPSLKSLANRFILLEKTISKTTKQMWSQEITDTQNYDFSGKEPYKIIVKAVFPKSWRLRSKEHKIQKFSKERCYQSASLISNKNTNALFLYGSRAYSALLIYKFDVNKLEVADTCDIFSEEYIEKQNPYYEKIKFDDVNIHEREIVNGKLHELYSFGVETTTPNYLISCCGDDSYNEVVLKDPEIVGVLSPDCASEEYAQGVAKSLNKKYLGVVKSFDVLEK